MYFICILLVQILPVICATTSSERAKLCVVEDNLSKCTILRAESTSFQSVFDCVGAQDRLGCLHKVANGEADVTSVPSNEAYAASVHLKTLIPLLEEQRFEGDFFYESVAVVKNTTNIKTLNDLKDKKACFTGYRRTAGWDIPIALLIAKGVVPCPFDDELAAVSSFFGKSCAPGSWSKNVDQNKKLKSNYKNLCELCDQLCNVTTTEKYAGYEGALKCLMEQSADIAFTKYSLVQNLSASNPELFHNYRFLCPNGTLNYLNNLCRWGARPNSLLITRNNLSSEVRTKLQTTLIELAEDSVRFPDLIGTVLMNKDSVGLRNISGSITDHLDKANFTVTMIKPLSGTCKEKYARFCVSSELDMAKCKDLKTAAFAARLRPNLECILKEDCNKDVDNNEADFIVSGLKNSYDVLTAKTFTSAMVETFPQNEPNYYLVAVIKKNSTIKTLKDLRGKKSCHSNFKCGAGYHIPKAVLASKKLISDAACEMDKQMSEFFSSSCVPGAPTDLTKLCSLCKGDAQNKSKCSDSDEYEGFVGAIRCLTEGGGDVAFVPHRLIASDPSRSQFQLLCTTDEVKTVDEFKTCNWASVPGRQLLFSTKIEESLRQSILLMLTQANSSFGLSSQTFKLYPLAQNSKKYTVVFSNGTTGLIMQEKKVIEDILGDNVVKLLKLVNCKSEAYTIKNNFLVLILASLATLRYVW